MERSYLAGYRRGKFSLEVLAGGVAAALRLPAHDDEAVDEVAEILRGLGYGDAPLASELGAGGGGKAWV